jgi:hypothetical protein
MSQVWFTTSVAAGDFGSTREVVAWRRWQRRGGTIVVLEGLDLAGEGEEEEALLV